jgi:Mce-associated membrane protein
MSDVERRPDSLVAGHRKVTAKPDKAAAKAAKASAKAAKAEKATAEAEKTQKAKAPKVKKPRSAPKFLRPVVGAAGKVVGFLASAPGKLGALWERAYDGTTARPVHAVRVLGIVVACVALLAGLFWFQTDRWARTEVARTEAVQAGESAVGLLLSYSFRSIDRQVEKTQDLVTGKFKDEYAQFVNGTVAPGAKDKQVVIRTAVDRSAVVDSSPGEVTLLMYVEQESEAKLTPGGVDSGVSGVRVTLEKEDGKWKVSELTPV